MCMLTVFHSNVRTRAGVEIDLDGSEGCWRKLWREFNRGGVAINGCLYFFARRREVSEVGTTGECER